ncbi:WUSCHEL-related homeobox 11-like [Andrographis paniculata]|uniref:WUSCHEL-related homeobox 11-like n=1 Tax=Andrographis paniculata TaxID=175694 RepID=UPI0021E79234|nr:WUSCHEL-related homeobox 11-like [Andrographis paniculata]
MGDRQAAEANSKFGNNGEPPVKSRWTPKPEQILILESIFNSGMVNPPKDETARIRKLLEQFGALGDANVFYWFQNRRSRSRRRQRQIQATLNNIAAGGVGEMNPQQYQLPPPAPGGNVIDFDQNYAAAGGFQENSLWNFPLPTSGMNTAGLVGSSSSSAGGFGGNSSDEFFSFSGDAHPDLQLQYDLNSDLCLTDASTFQNYQPAEVMTVFINGVGTEVVRGAPVDLKAMFGGDFVLFHSSGAPAEVNEYGYAVHLEHGESYFLVPKCSSI